MNLFAIQTKCLARGGRRLAYRRGRHLAARNYRFYVQAHQHDATPLPPAGTPQLSGRRYPTGPSANAFTLIELLVVIAIIAILAALLLPALSRTKFKTRVLNCASNYKQWTLAVNMYAPENGERLPSWDCPGGGSWMWDEGTNFVPVMQHYGMTFQMYFCPVRPDEIKRYTLPNGGPPRTLDELTAAMTRLYQETIMVHAWWVPRKGGGARNNGIFPGPQTGTALNNTSDSGKDWPVKTTDRAALQVPFISDASFSGGGGTSASAFDTPADLSSDHIRKDTSHFYNGSFSSVNLGFADGHVSSSTRTMVKARQPSGDNGTYWFY